MLSILGGGVGMRNFSTWKVRYSILDHNEHSLKYCFSPWENIKMCLCIYHGGEKIENDQVEGIRVLGLGG